MRGPCPPGERRGACARGGVNIPIMVGERHSHIYGERELIEREIVDVEIVAEVGLDQVADVLLEHRGNGV